MVEKTKEEQEVEYLKKRTEEMKDAITKFAEKMIEVRDEFKLNKDQMLACLRFTEVTLMWETDTEKMMRSMFGE